MSSNDFAIPDSTFTHQSIEKRTISGILRPDFAKRADKRKHRERDAPSVLNNKNGAENDRNEAMPQSPGIHPEHFSDDVVPGMFGEPRHGAIPSINSPQNAAGLFSKTSSSLKRKVLPPEKFDSSTTDPYQPLQKQHQGTQDIMTHSYSIDSLKFKILEDSTPPPAKPRQSITTKVRPTPTNELTHYHGALSPPARQSYYAKIKARQINGRTSYPGALQPYSQPIRDNAIKAREMSFSQRAYYTARNISQPITTRQSDSRHRPKNPDRYRSSDLKYSQINHFLLSLTGEVLSLNHEKQTEFKVGVWSLVQELKNEERSESDAAT